MQLKFTPFFTAVILYLLANTFFLFFVLYTGGATCNMPIPGVYDGGDGAGRAEWESARTYRW